MAKDFASQITYGGIERMINDDTATNIVVQILGTKEIVQAEGAGGKRLRVTLWDGVQEYKLGMVASQMYRNFEDQLVDYSVIKINQFNGNKCRDKLVLVLMDIELLGSGSQISEKLTVTPQASTSRPVLSENRGANKTVPQTPPKSATRPRPIGTPQTPSGTPLTPIAAINPYQSKWTIKARVSSKSAIKTWSKASSEGKLFSFEVYDESGEIRLTAFNAEVDKFYDIIQPKQVYFISRCQCKAANKNFRTANNDYELTLNKFSTVELCTDSVDDIPDAVYNFVKIKDLESIPTDNANFVDICAIVQNTGDVQTFNRKSDGKALTKRELQIVDDSQKIITMTLWNDDAANFDGTDNPCLVVTKARLSSFNGGLTIGTSTGSTMEVNPDNEEANRLQKWWHSTGKHQSNFEAIKGGSGAGGDFAQEWMDFQIVQAKSEVMDVSEKPIYIWNRLTVNMFNKENALYKACANADCNKKVQDNDGVYRCEKCNVESGNYKWRIILKMSLSDATNQFWATAFNEAAEQILGTSAPELGAYSEEDQDKFDEVFAKAVFKEWHMKFRGKMDIFQEERRFQLSVMQAKEVNLIEDSKFMLQDIEAMAKKL